jgi:hypothetical protein
MDQLVGCFIQHTGRVSQQCWESQKLQVYVGGNVSTSVGPISTFGTWMVINDVLQTLLTGNAVSYYLTWGYICAPLNLITYVPSIHEDQFANIHVHFVSDKFQKKKRMESGDFLVLHYVEGFVVNNLP